MGGQIPSLWAPLGVPRFRSLWLAGLLSWYGDFLTLPALLIISYDLGGETGVGLMLVFQMVPLLVLLPSGGQLGDSGNRQRRLVALDLVRAALAAVMVVADQSHLLVLVVIAVAGSRSAAALYDPGRRRLVAVLLPEELVPAGGSLLSAVSETSILVAPGIGALLLLVGVSPALLIVIDGCTFLASAVLTAQVGPQPAVWSRQRSMALQGWRSLRRGFDLLLLDPTIALFAIQAALGAMLAGVIVVYFVPIAHHSLHLPTSRVGLLYVIIGAASVAGSLFAIRRPRVGRSGLISVGYFHLVVAILVGILLGPAVVVIALVLFAGTGVMQEIWGLNRLQTTTPRDGIGQAFGSALWCQFLGRAVGAAVGAWGASHLSQAEFFYLVVLAAVVVCVFITISRPVWWRRRSTNWPPISPPLPLDP